MKVNERTPERRTRLFWLVVGLVAILSSACQPGVTPAARPTPVILSAQITPALSIFATQLQQCAADQPGVGLVLQDFLPTATPSANPAIVLRWGAGEKIQGFAAVIGQEQLVVVASPQNPLDQISWNDLQAIYKGKLRAWQAPATAGEIQAWAYPAGDDVQAVFESAVLNGTQVAAQSVSLAPNPAAMREAIARNAAAIGFLPRQWVDSSVKTLIIKDLDPTRLTQPILALSKLEPKDPEKSWLLCLQERLK